MTRYIAAGLVAGLLALISVGTASADHRLYLAERNTSVTYAVNAWMNYDGTLRWCSDDNQMYNNNVIVMWEQTFPTTDWVLNCSTVDVWIRSYTSGSYCPATAGGCVATWRVALNGDRGGYYITGADIWINDQNWNFRNLGRIAVANHEAGHVHGLDERYRHSGDPCNPNDFTIMDAVVVVGGQINGGCDTNAPVGSDLMRVQAFYDLAAAENPVIVEYNGFAVTWHWTDVNWAESYYPVNYYYWNGSAWQFVRTNNHSNSVAPGRPSNPGDVSRSFSRPTGWPAGWYTSCIQTHNKVYGTKHWVCSPNAYLQ